MRHSPVVINDNYAFKDIDAVLSKSKSSYVCSTFLGVENVLQPNLSGAPSSAQLNLFLGCGLIKNVEVLSYARHDSTVL